MAMLKIYDGSQWVNIAGNGPIGPQGIQGETGTYPRSLQMTADLRGMWLTTPYWKFLDMTRGSASFPSGCTITSWYVDCNSADPTTELNANLKYCDSQGTGAFPGANPVLIDVLDTTTGNSSCTDMSGSDLGSGVIPAGKVIYLELDADPVDLATTWTITINFSAVGV
jgi:hypothetical protein